MRPADHWATALTLLVALLSAVVLLTHADVLRVGDPLLPLTVVETAR